MIDDKSMNRCFKDKNEKKAEAYTQLGSKYSHLISAHPCFSEKAHFNTARIHVPVARLCNIQCNYCIRKIDKCEYRPGVCSSVSSPEEGIKRVERAFNDIKELKVVGVAGPGDAIANKETFELFKLVDEKYPSLIKCIATNGLLLPEKIQELKDLNVHSITVTINAVEPSVGSKIYAWVKYNDKIYRGEEGARLLIEKQFKGVEEACKSGFVVKINTVLIPEINMSQVEGIAEKSAKYGVNLMNIIPLIPIHHFGNTKPPTCDELTIARTIAERYVPQFRLCRQCRADSVGIPGMESCGPHGKEYFHG